MSCARNIDCAVTTFHELPLPKGEPIRIEPMDPAKWGSLEFKEYASMIAVQLKAVGYTPVGKGEAAELISEVDYKIEPGQTKITRRPGSYVRYHFITVAITGRIIMVYMTIGSHLFIARPSIIVLSPLILYRPGDRRGRIAKSYSKAGS